MQSYAFEVYGLFGRTYHCFPIPQDETHHATLDKARNFLLAIERSGKKAWIRLLNTSNDQAHILSEAK